MRSFLTSVAALAVFAAPALADSDPITPIADAQRGSFATVEGEVARILDEDTFRLADASGAIRIYIGPNRMPVRTGDAVRVTGFVDDGFGPREIYADGLVQADGTEIQFDRRYD